MKKITLLILLMGIALALCGCSGNNTDAQSATSPSPTPYVAPTAAAQEQPFIASTPAPTATPFPRVAAEDYVLIWKNDKNRGINYQVPSHWTLSESGERYLVYLEPVPEGETGYRAAFANKKMSSEPDSAAMKKQLNSLLTCMQEQYTDFQYQGPISRDVSLVRFKGYSVYYTYTAADQTSIKGFVIIATYNRRIYMMNWSGPVDRFEEMQAIGVKILQSVSRVSTTSK